MRRSAVALAVAGNPRYGKIDPQLAAEHAVLEAVRNVVAVGARPLGLTDCLNFGDPTVPEHLGAMVAAIDGLAYAARRLGTPFVSGNVSLYNQSKSGARSRRRRSWPASADQRRIALATPGFKRRRLAAALRRTPQRRFGGSVFAEMLAITGGAPSIDYAQERREMGFVLEAARPVTARRARRVGRRHADRSVRDGVSRAVGRTRRASCAPAMRARVRRIGGFVLEADVERIGSLNALYVERTERWAMDGACLGEVVPDPVRSASDASAIWKRCAKPGRRRCATFTRAAPVVSATVGIVVFPGTNSEEETLRACRAVGVEAEMVPLDRGLDRARAFDAYVLPGGFAYEDRVRAGAIAAHEGSWKSCAKAPAAANCSWASATARKCCSKRARAGHRGFRRVEAGLARNAPAGRFVCRPVHVKLAIPPGRCALTVAAMCPTSVMPGEALSTWGPSVRLHRRQPGANLSDAERR